MDSKNKKKKIKLDKFYNPIENKSPYSDKLSEVVDEIVEAQTSGKITTGTATSLIKIAVIMETKKEVQELDKWVEALRGTQEKSSMLVNIFHKEKKYA